VAARESRLTIAVADIFLIIFIRIFPLLWLRTVGLDSVSILLAKGMERPEYFWEPVPENIFNNTVSPKGFSPSFARFSLTLQGEKTFIFWEFFCIIEK
jgi:hypothetical protein